MQQRWRRRGEWNQLLLKRVTLIVVGIGKKSTAEGDKVMDIRHGGPVYVGEFNDEILARPAVHLDALRSRSAGQDSRDPILHLPVRNDLQLITPSAFSLQPQAAATLRFHLIAFNFSLAARQAAWGAVSQMLHTFS